MLLTNKYYISEVVKMSKRTKTEQVVRRVVLGREYQVFSMSFKDGVPNMDLLETLQSDKRPTESEMVEKYKVSKVVILPTKIITGYYAVPIDKFMEIAELVDQKEKTLSAEETSEETSEEGETNE
jgi:hypothetical protein